MNKEIMRGEDAERMLNDPLFKECEEKVRNGIYASMRQSPVGDKETHHQLVITLQLLDNLIKNFKEVAETGKLARIQLEEESRFKKVMKRFA